MMGSVINFSKLSAQSLLDCALKYADRGWPVFPLHHCNNGQCSCKRQCNSPGKHPRTRRGFKDATTDPETIRKWWIKWPDANIGLVTGALSGIVVLDVDPGHGGTKSLVELTAINGELPNTLTVNTGGGGQHFIFRYPDRMIRNSQGSLAEGLDIRGNGGYIVAEPSVHISGLAYQFVNPEVPPAEIPTWLLDRITLPTKVSHSDDLTIPAGNRNNSLTSLAGLLRRQGKREDEIYETLLNHNNKHCAKPLKNAEVKKIASSVMNYDARPLLFRWRDGWISDEGPDEAGVRHVLWALSRYMDTHAGTCFPTQDQLSQDTRITRKTVGKHLKQAETLGWIERQSKKNKQGRWNHIYKATFPDE